jgi:hypothetical protein
VRTLFYAIIRPFSPQFDGSVHTERTRFGDLHEAQQSGSWRAQARRKGKYVNETFLRRKDAGEWALETERRIARIAEVEPLLQEIDAQHALEPERRTPVPRLWIERFDQAHNCVQGTTRSISARNAGRRVVLPQPSKPVAENVSCFIAPARSPHLGKAWQLCAAAGIALLQRFLSASAKAGRRRQ